MYTDIYITYIRNPLKNLINEELNSVGLFEGKSNRIIGTLKLASNKLLKLKTNGEDREYKLKLKIVLNEAVIKEEEREEYISSIAERIKGKINDNRELFIETIYYWDGGSIEDIKIDEELDMIIRLTREDKNTGDVDLLNQESGDSILLE